MEPTRPTWLRVGEVARRAGVHLQTLRYYERRGLLPAPPRTEAGYRAYPPGAVDRVRLIKRAQGLGFTLQEIGELLALRAAPGACCADVRRRAEAKLQVIDEKIRTLEAMRSALGGLIAACADQEGPASECPILDAMEPERS
ncbi:MAG: heavy metal-responsive transcriptional regulator [Acidobacteriota bacterium]|nr:heavy metal-responsive transcriptional regulator [Acidobacteriota bacterium]MDQ7088139.1 heavy metal-responsive transcriptional regulator [Acidobacteriota bacterium]